MNSFIVNVKQSESAQKPLNTVLRDICKHEVLGGFFSSYAEYSKTKSEMQDWLVAQKIVQEILKEDEQKKEQLHEKEVRQEEENKENSR